MEIHYQTIEQLPDHVAWVKCEPSELDKVREIFPVEEYEILVGIKPTYDPITCDYQTLMNPPPPIWGVDVSRKRENAGHQDLSPRENS